MNFDVLKNTIYLVKHGSHAYDLNRPDSDLDIKGICIPPRDYILGYAFHFEQKENDPKLKERLGYKEVDSVIYGIQKFFQLAAQCNPNIIEILYADESDILLIDNFGKALRNIRDLFLSKKARHTFAGYAHSQLKRIKSHRAWLLNPPKEKPLRSDFGLPEHEKIVNNDALGTIKSLGEKGYGFSEELMTAIVKEKQYATALQQWNQYQNWKQNRNPDRAALEAKYGYDTKFAMHLVRLSKLCLEILRGDGVIVKRPDREELLAIRDGKWRYEELIEYAEWADNEAEKLYKTSTLPHKPDVKHLNKICQELITSYWDFTSATELIENSN